MHTLWTLTDHNSLVIVCQEVGYLWTALIALTQFICFSYSHKTKEIQYSADQVFSLFRPRPTTMCLWRLQLRRPRPVWLCCWGPWGSGCVATAPGSWPSTTGPLPVCCSGLAHTLMPAWWAQLPIGPPSRMLLARLVPARRSHLPPLWARKFPWNNLWC